MQFIVYVVILVVAVFSVGLEWDALVSPSTKISNEMQTVSHLGKPQSAPADNAQIKTGDGAQAADDAQAQKTVAARQCDVNVCAAAYTSFRASDCTYQPYGGPRRLCSKGAPQVASVDAQAEAPASLARCHLRACAETYSSFNPQDCTYQPLDGPRHVCEK